MEVEEIHFIYNTLNTLFSYMVTGMRHMVEDHSDSERGNPLLLLHRLLSPISTKGFFVYAPSTRKDCTYDRLCYTSHGTLAGKRNGS